MWLTISLRNIMQNGRGSPMTVLAIALGFAAINLFQGYVHSTYQGLTNAAIHGEGLGHITIFKKDYRDQGKLHPEQFQFSRDEVERISVIVRRESDVRLITPRLSVSGILSNGRNSTIFIAEGLVPAEDKEIRGGLSKYTSFSGTYLDDKERAGVVIGSELAAMLDLKVGSDAVILSNTYTGMANALDAKIAGVYNTGNTATNDKMLLMTFRHAQELMDVSGAERLVILLKDGRKGNDLLSLPRGRSWGSSGAARDSSSSSPSTALSRRCIPPTFLPARPIPCRSGWTWSGRYWAAASCLLRCWH
jgi:putative ABC transport system permease protein